ncbi:FG-GAP-like repeat-containing protein [Leptothoe sp. ISB3NOV94-8A]
MSISPFSNSFGQMQFADLDNDGDQDALTTNKFWNPYTQSFMGSSYVLINNGIGGLTPASVLPANNVVDHLLGYLDSDTDLDIFMVKDSDQLNQVFLNNGDGTFVAAPTQPAGGLSNALDGELGDMDGDGDLDAVILQNHGYQQSFNYC